MSLRNRPCSWQVDSSSWEFLGQEDDDDEDEDDNDDVVVVGVDDEGETNPAADSTSSTISSAATKTIEKKDEDESENVIEADAPKARAEDLDDVADHEVEEEEEIIKKEKSSRELLHEAVLELSSDPSTLFARSVAQFVKCTEESPERDPAAVVRNVRQFLTGIKNFLVRSGEGRMLEVIREEREKVS